MWHKTMNVNNVFRLALFEFYKIEEKTTLEAVWDENHAAASR